MEAEKKTRKPKVKKEVKVALVEEVKPVEVVESSGQVVYLGICVKTGEKLYKKV